MFSTEYWQDVTSFWSFWLTTTLLLLQGRLVRWWTLQLGGPRDLGWWHSDDSCRAMLCHRDSGFLPDLLWPFRRSRWWTIFIQLPLGCAFWLITRSVETKLALMIRSVQEQNPHDKEIRNISFFYFVDVICVYSHNVTMNFHQSYSKSSIFLQM